MSFFSSFEVSQKSTTLCEREIVCGRSSFAGGLPLLPDVHHPLSHFRPEGQKQPRNEARILSLAKHTIEFEPTTFGCWVKRFLTHRATLPKLLVTYARPTSTIPSLTLSKSSHQRCSVEKGVLRNFAKFTGKHLCQSLFFNKVAGAACNFIKQEILAQVFSCEFCEISENTFFTEHLRTTASGCRVFFFIVPEKAF